MQVKERPILFSAPMVRALLDGTKTQTRRVCKLTDAAHIKEVGGHRRWHPADPDVVAASPYGQIGDQLWVREAFCDATDGLHGRVLYRATGDTACKWKPSIHMFRHQSRITLEITSVRVERLQDITAADALAEGIRRFDYGGAPENKPADYYNCDHIDNYADIWVDINGIGSWELNPWVWVIEFKKVKP